MKLCIPTVESAGLHGRMSGHFGSAPFFTMVDTESGACVVVANGGAVHQHGTCEAAGGMEGHAVDAVVCRGLGRRALAGLAAAGIAVYVADAEDAAAALAQYRAGSLSPMAEAAACGGGAGHAHGPGGAGGCGRGPGGR